MKQSLLGALALAGTLAGTLAACGGSTSPTGSDATSLTGQRLAGQDSTSAGGEDSNSGGGQDSTSAGGRDSTSGGTTEPDTVPNRSAWVRVIGTLAQCDYCMIVGGGAATVPGTANAGQPFSITVYTIATSSCIKDAGTEVKVRDSLARVVAYDSIPAPESGIGCAAVMTRMRHDARVRFESSGKAIVRVVGYRGLGREKRLDSLDYTVTVSP